MIDAHCHILPGIDDGPATMEESLAMCAMAAADGVEAIVATPHMLKGYRFTPDDILNKTEELNHALEKAGIPLRVYPGAEVAADPDIPLLLRRKDIMTVNGAGKYLFLELTEFFPLDPVTTLINELRADGVTVVITHPERNSRIQKKPQLLADIIAGGALAQVTAMSITGDFGRKTLNVSRLLLKRGLVHIIASDAHSLNARPPLLSKAVNEAGLIVGTEAARAMVSGKLLDDLL